MKIVPQIVVVLLLAGVTVPVAARFVPGTHPWLDRAGLLRPLVAMGLVAETGEETAEPRGASGGAAITVSAAPVEKRRLSDVVSVIGSGRGVRAVDLSFPLGGRLTQLAVAPGERVSAGQLVAELDSAAALLAVERARLVREDARRTLDRLDQLAQSGTATALQRQDAELALRTAELEVQAAERTLEDHRLVAPFAGFIGLIEPQIGDLVAAGALMTRVEDRSRLIIDFRVPERVATSVQPGDALTARAVSGTDAAVEGRIVAVDNRVDEASRTLRVQALVDNPEDRLRAGMAFQVDLAFTGPEYPAVDPLAIQWGSEGAYLWIVRLGKAERLPIRIMQRNADAVLVEAALAPDDLVVTEGVHLLRPGADVSVAPPRS